MRVKAIRINPYNCVSLPPRLGNVGGVTPTAEMVRKNSLPKKMYVEVDSLISWLRFINKKYNADEFNTITANNDFIEVIEGNLKECADEKNDIEWI